MAGSQLKRLKASLRDQGIVGPQQSKKQRKKNAQDPKAADRRVQRAEALTSIREQHNPFQFKMNARGPKFDVTTLRPTNAGPIPGATGRPGVSRAKGEEKRRQTLLVEMQQRNKVGGMNDRRFGEADPNMSYEQKMAERFAAEMRRGHKKSIFDLEDEDPSEGLTHMGKPLSFVDDTQVRDDFEDLKLMSGDESDVSLSERRKRKRALTLEEGGENGGEDEREQPERKKTQKEIYQEVIAKSKLHKYERQAAKEEDSELREELDKQLPELQALLRQREKPTAQVNKDGSAARPVAGIDRAALEKEYDRQLRELARDARAAPTEKTKTEDEMAKEHSERLQELELQRQRRMRGEILEEEEEDEEEDEDENEDEGEQEQPGQPHSSTAEIDAEVDQFGLGKGVRMRPSQLVLDDEDEFLIEDDLVASGSDIDVEDSDDLSDGAGEDSEPESEDDLVKGLLTEVERLDPVFKDPAKTTGTDSDGVPYVLPCPQDHKGMLDMFTRIDISKQPIAVRRIRALFHPRLDAQNKEKLGKFARALVQHISFLGEGVKPEWIPTLESLIRHVHSLAKTHPIEVASEYRLYIEEMGKQRPLSLHTGDLLILTAVGSTFPTSDHWHEVVTPAQLTIARYLGQKVPESLADYATGTYLSILAVHFQRLSKRYIPELLNFTLNTLCALSPEKLSERIGFFPVHDPPPGTRIKGASATGVRKLNFSDCRLSDASNSDDEQQQNSLKISILDTTAAVLREAAQTFAAHAAFIETFQPAQRALSHLCAAPCSPNLPPALVNQLDNTKTLLSRLSQVSRLARRPLELHHHRPRPIPTYVPKLAEADGRFDPRKHYDPDRERAALAKLTAEHQRERKGAMRELRRDAAFVARERLRQKRERDAAYEHKFKRLVAEIQGEEGHAANEYDRERRMRKKKR